MAGSSLLALLDDIATTLDDIAVMTKVAAKKTAGVLGDDLALNAQQVTGINADRELPVVWGVAKGSFVNKCILIPVALGVSQLLPWLVTPLLMIGGLFLCYEGAEKILEKLFGKKNLDEPTASEAATVNLADLEKERIKGAVRTDFILSAEIIVITLGTAAHSPLLHQALVLCGVGVGMTVGVYGLVAAIVKFDDLGLWLMQKPGALAWVGQGCVKAAPMIMKFLGVAGTIAMFLVGGGILAHGISGIHHWQESLHWSTAIMADLALGILAGLVVVGAKGIWAQIRGRFNRA
ncbi:MAG: DUF808 domain-containing protein [Bdellovibrionales bacterium]|nr:DUF808 domain-containing protein [Bdellovibrionales bacterium]